MGFGRGRERILDFFANEADEILNSFQPYYELTTIESSTDPNHLYDLKSEIEKVREQVQNLE